MGQFKNLLPLQDPAHLVVERREERPSVMNAFELISTSQGLNLGQLFEKQMVLLTMLNSKMIRKKATK
jgi:hypothetical protein